MTRTPAVLIVCLALVSCASPETRPNGENERLAMQRNIEAVICGQGSSEDRAHALAAIAGQAEDRPIDSVSQDVYNYASTVTC